MVEDLVARVFYARNVTHFSHWRTSSYAQHMALGAFYDDVVTALDAFVEAYQGLRENIGSIPTPGTKEMDPVKLLEEQAAWIEKHHDDLCGGSRALANLADGITEVYLTTLYKLKNLK